MRVHVGIEKLETTGQCPVGTHEFHDDTLTIAPECALNRAFPTDLDLEIMDASQDVCVEPDLRANGIWVRGETSDGARPPFVSRTWQPLEQKSQELQEVIGLVELDKFWRRGPIHLVFQACIRAHHNRDTQSADIEREQLRSIDTMLQTHGDLMRVWGNMNKLGFITPFYVRVERKHPRDYTRRVVFAQQSGLLGTEPTTFLSSEGDMSQHRATLVQLATRLATLDSAYSHSVETVVESIIDVERSLAQIYGTTASESYIEYMENPQEFGVDMMTYSALQNILSNDLSLNDFYTALGGTVLQQRASQTSHWVFKPSFYAMLAPLVASIPIDVWRAYCKISIMMDTRPFLPHMYGATHTARQYRDHRAVEPHDIAQDRGTDLERHRRMYAAWVRGKDVSLADRQAEHHIHVGAPHQGIRSGWMTPWHPIRKPRWMTQARSDLHRVPLSWRHVARAQSRYAQQGLDSLEARAEFSIYFDTCSIMTSVHLQDRIDKWFVDTIVDEETRERLHYADDLMRGVLREDISASDLSEATKREMIAKVDLIHLRIGALDEDVWFDPAVVLDHDTRDEIPLVEAMYMLRRATIAHNFDLLATQPGPDGDNENDPLLMPAHVPNAYYDAPGGTCTYLAGAVGLPLYHAKYDNMTLFAKAGVVIMHERNHGFDTTGQYFDGHGNARYWVAPEDESLLNANMDCIIAQYSQETRYGNRHNGMNTRDENIADIKALQIAWRAWLRTDGARDTDENLMKFAMLFAQMWAEQTTPYSDYLAIDRDVHATVENRIKRSLENWPEFSRRICNREPVCRLWRK